MAWSTHVSQRSWRAYQRGGTWLQPHVWEACRAKAQQQRQRWGAGTSWRGYGSSYGYSRPAPTLNPKVRVQPKRPEANTKGQASSPKPGATPATADGKVKATGMAALLAQIEQQRKLIDSLRVSMENGGLEVPAPLAAAQPSQTAQDATQLLWAQRRVEAAKKLAQ